MKSLLVLLTALTAGCALNPAEIRQSATPTEAKLQRAPMGAAACVDRNIENNWDSMWGAYSGRVREGIKPGTAELSVPYVLAADFVPTGGGSTVTIYASPHVVSGNIERVMAAFKGC